MSDTVKIQLKDMTKSQMESFVTRCGQDCQHCIFWHVNCNENSDSYWLKHKDIFSDMFLNQCIELKFPFLEDTEKDFLKKFTDLYPAEIISITRMYDKDIGLDYLLIISKNSYDENDISLPYFKHNTAYTGLKENTPYTLCELFSEGDDYE